MTVLVFGFLLLGFAWLFSTPPFQAPDESAHYLRALTITDGVLLGPKVPIDQVGRAMLGVGGWHAAEERWIDHDRRGVFVPARLSPPGTLCLNDTADVRSGCVEATYTGDYSPLAYLVPAAAMSSAQSATTALWLARAGSLLVALAWLAVALALAGPGIGWRTVGMLAATTPTMLFISSVLNPSGLEIAANLAFIGGLARVRHDALEVDRRDSGEIPRWVWWATALSGATTILAWQLGPLFVVADLAAFAGLLGPDPLRVLGAAARRRAMISILVLAGAAAVWLLWGELSGALHSSFRLTPLGGSISSGYTQLGPTLRGAVGVFGALTVALPSPVCEIWWAFVVVLLLGALGVGDRRERTVLAVATIAVLAFPVVFYAFLSRQRLRHAGPIRDAIARPCPHDQRFSPRCPRANSGSRAHHRLSQLRRGLPVDRLVVQRATLEHLGRTPRARRLVATDWLGTARRRRRDRRARAVRGGGSVEYGSLQSPDEPMRSRAACGDRANGARLWVRLSFGSVRWRSQRSASVG